MTEVNIPALKAKTWNRFVIHDLFVVQGTVTTKPGDLQANGTTPRITCSSVNNGVDNFYQNAATENGGVLTVDSAAVGAIFYQPFAFIATDHIEKIMEKDGCFCEYVGLFLQTAFSVSISGKYEYGYKFSKKRIRQQIVVLPTDEMQEPDYVYMKQYISKIRRQKMAQYTAYAEKRIAELGDYIEIPALEKKQWGRFHIGDLFTVSRPAARNKDSYQDGSIPFVASGAVNNGVVKCCTPAYGEEPDAGNCITVSPVDGTAFYQPMFFLGRGGAGSSILILRAGFLDAYIGQFCARMVQNTTSKYTYGHMGNKDGIRRESIMLPVGSSGSPDYGYMGQYIKNLMLRKYRQYLDYLGNA